MENKRRKLLAVLFLLFCLLGIAALYGQARQPAEGTGGHSSNRQKVTLIAKSTESAFWKSVFAGASAAGTEYNMELLCQGADNEEDYISQNQMPPSRTARTPSFSPPSIMKKMPPPLTGRPRPGFASSSLTAM